MSAIGVGLVWWSYWWGLGGYSFIQGWNNNLLALANPFKIATFTTECYTGSRVFPTGDPGDSGPCGSSSAKKHTQVGVFKPGKGGKCPAGSKLNPKTGNCERLATPPLGH